MEVIELSPPLTLCISIPVFSCKMTVSRPDGSIYSTTRTVDASQYKECRKVENKGKYSQ